MAPLPLLPRRHAECPRVTTVRQPVVQTGEAANLGRQSDPHHFLAPAKVAQACAAAIGTTGETWLAPSRSLLCVICGQMSLFLFTFVTFVIFCSSLPIGKRCWHFRVHG